jgi:UDP-GlcNAc:undecaprenyl-phosphate GlcNAc-1-phosphate transferase
MRSPWRKKASIFMGDAGSMSLGLMVGWYAIKLTLLTQEVHAVPGETFNVLPWEGRILEPMAVAWVLAVPIWDECAQFYRRVREGHHPFWPDLGHFHHHFIRAGFLPCQTSLSIHFLVFLLGGFGVIGAMAGVPLPVLTIVWIIGILAHMAFSKNLENYTGVLKKLSKA